MARDKSRAWLDRLLAGEHLTPGDLQVLVEECPEGQFIDYKAGAVLEERDPAGLVRKYAASFGNADGGVLMIGYDANPKVKRFDGAKAPGGGALAEWASRAMTQVPQLAPRLSAVSVDEKEVLLVSVPRCRALAPVVEQGEPAYYLRLGEQTLRMPPYLIHDLMLGRRVEPELRPRLHRAVLEEQHLEQASAHWYVRALQMALVVEDVGLSSAEDVRVGLVAWCPSAPRQEATSTLQQSVDAVKPEVLFARRPLPDWMLGHFRLRRFARPGEARPKPTLDLAPFEQTAPELLDPWPLVIFQALPGPTHRAAPPSADPTRTLVDAITRAETRGATRVSAALYVLAKNCAPWWYELKLEYDQAVMGWDDNKLLEQLRLEPVTEGRPRVAVDFLPEDWVPPP